MATLTDIACRNASRAPMDRLPECEISADGGVHTDSRGKPGHRQVTLLSEDTWAEVCRELNAELPWTTRRANLLIEGLTFGEADVGRHVEIGNVVLEITGETAPCPRMDEQHQGLTEALKSAWRGGVCCRVVKGGRVARGDAVTVS